MHSVILDLYHQHQLFSTCHNWLETKSWNDRFQIEYNNHTDTEGGLEDWPESTGAIIDCFDANMILDILTLDWPGDGIDIEFVITVASSFDFFEECLFFDRMMRMMMIRIMRMIRIEREMRMIVRVDRALTVKDSWVWMNPSWLEAWIVIDVDGNVDEGIPEMIPVDWLRDRPGGRVPEVIVNRGLSPEMIGEIENDCPLMRVNENWE